MNETVYFGETLAAREPQEGYVTLLPDQKNYRIQGVITVGRDPANDICIKDPFISSRHCQFEQRANGYFIRDLKSRNGIKVNGLRVGEGELLDNSEILVGSTRFVFNTKVPESASTESGLISKNNGWNDQLKQLPSIAESDLPIFLQGESGTGKEVLAHHIHKLSLRRFGPFIGVNCSALSESLVESELFGHVKGSFTGASMDRKGAFEMARGGTLFLDEIGDLPLALQPKLLRALENREIKPVGSDKVIQTDVRIVTATHKNLEKLIEQNLFRADLYFRIHVIKVAIPALRERIEDFESFFYQFCRESKVSFSAEAITVLKKNEWPGNIRELKNLISRAKALHPSAQIQLQHLDALLSRKPITGDEFTATLEGSASLPLIKQVEREMIKTRLAANNYNQRRTAADLGIPKSTLHDRIKAYNIKVKSR